jgi:hypothetical protein
MMHDLLGYSTVCNLESSLAPYVRVEKEAEENSSLFLVFERLLHGNGDSSRVQKILSGP